MTSRIGAPLAALAAILAIGTVLYSNLYKGKPVALDSYPATFEKVSNNVYRQGYLWPVPVGPPGMKVDVHVFLIKVGQDYFLVDVGAPGEEYERLLSNGLREAVKDGKLRLVLLTHGHIDHVGALVSVSKEYPDVQTVLHQAEAPFLTGNVSYGDIPNANPLFKESKFDVSSALPASRVLLLTGESGDISNARGPSGQKPAWQIPKGTVFFHHGPGHSPGHVSYLHKPSGSLIAGDIFGNMGQPAKISGPTPMYTPNMTESNWSLKRIANVDFVRAFCAHDRLVGVTREDLQQFTATL